MKIDINKIKNLNWKLKLFICIIVTIVGFICIQVLLNNWEYKVENYDYSKIYSINGVITNAYFEEDYDITTKVYDSSAYIDIKLETGETVSIGLGGTLDYSEGEDIIVYTDGTNYSITEKGVAADAQYTIINLLLTSVIEIFLIIVWSILFGWKGFGIGFLIIIFYLTAQE